MCRSLQQMGDGVARAWNKLVDQKAATGERLLVAESGHAVATKERLHPLHSRSSKLYFGVRCWKTLV